MEKLEKGEGIGGVVVVWSTKMAEERPRGALPRHSSLLLLGKGNAAVAAARREKLGRRCWWLSWGRKNVADCCVS